MTKSQVDLKYLRTFNLNLARFNKEMHHRALSCTLFDFVLRFQPTEQNFLSSCPSSFFEVSPRWTSHKLADSLTRHIPAVAKWQLTACMTAETLHDWLMASWGQHRDTALWVCVHVMVRAPSWRNGECDTWVDGVKRAGLKTSRKTRVEVCTKKQACHREWGG